MKKKIFRILALSFVIMLIVPFASAEKNEVKAAKEDASVQSMMIQEVLDTALEADGVEAESSFDAVLRIFQEDVSNFLNVFQEYAKEDQDRILWMIAESAAISRSEGFLPIISSFNKEDEVYLKLKQNYESILALVESISDESPIEVPQYDTDTIISLAAAYLKNRETNNVELLTHLAKAYYAGPVAMADAFEQNFSYEERKQLAAGIAGVCAKAEDLELQNMFKTENSHYREHRRHYLSRKINHICMKGAYPQANCFETMRYPDIRLRGRDQKLDRSIK